MTKIALVQYSTSISFERINKCDNEGMPFGDILESESFVTCDQKNNDNKISECPNKIAQEEAIEIKNQTLEHRKFDSGNKLEEIAIVNQSIIGDFTLSNVAADLLVAPYNMKSISESVISCQNNEMRRGMAGLGHMGHSQIPATGPVVSDSATPSFLLPQPELKMPQSKISKENERTNWITENNLNEPKTNEVLENLTEIPSGEQDFPVRISELQEKIVALISDDHHNDASAINRNASLQIGKNNQGQEIKFVKLQLHPLNLGQLTLCLYTQDEGIRIVIQAQTIEGLEKLSEEKDDILRGLDMKGVPIVDVQIRLDSSSGYELASAAGGHSNHASFEERQTSQRNGGSDGGQSSDATEQSADPDGLNATGTYI